MWLSPSALRSFWFPFCFWVSNCLKFSLNEPYQKTYCEQGKIGFSDGHLDAPGRDNRLPLRGPVS